MSASHDPPVREVFSSYLVIALVGGASQVNVSPNATLSSRSAGLADTYSLYRVLSLKFRLRRVGTLTSSQIAAYLPGVTDNPPSTISTIAEVVNSTVLAVTDTVPSSWVVVPSHDLRGMQPWYKTIVGSPDPGQETLGVIAVVGTGTETYALEVRGEFEFSSPVATANTPAMLLAQKMVHDELVRQRMSQVSATYVAPSGLKFATPFGM